MSHKLDDITLYYYPEGEAAKKFTLKQNVVSDLYVQYLNGFKPPKTSRISVELTDKNQIRGYFGSILTVDAQFDKDNFWKLSDKKQNEAILETVHHVALLCADKYEWDKKVFNEAYRKVLQTDFKYKIEGKKKSSRDRTHKAAVQIEKDETCTTISAVFYDQSDNKLKTVELLRSFQHIMFYGGIVKDYKWFSNSEFGLFALNEELIIRASLDEVDSKIIINPIDTSKEEIENFLRSITYQEFNNCNEGMVE